MTSQWGRDSGFPASSKRGSGLLRAVVLILALAAGAAGGYAGFRYSHPDDGAALDLARAQIDELNATIARQAGELDVMAERLAASSRQAPSPENTAVDAVTRERDVLAAENQKFQAELAALEAERDAGDQAAGAEKQRLEAELARLQTEVVPDLTAERDRLQRKTTVMLEDQATLKARIKAAADRNAADAATIADLQSRLAEAERDLSVLQTKLAAEQSRQTEAQTLDTATTTGNQTPVPVAEEDAGTPPADVGLQDAPGMAPRDPDAVARALQAAPGLAPLTGRERQQLTIMLAAGECVTDALAAVFDRIPILTLRNLIRDLNSDC
ncbi:hypothetical protein [uncultured Hoeflea sp.]|uniref:hypothetical protein n=1 Tax=uncultured Hoeflea sp. TaxID=538666 RepID=UPI0030D799DC